MKGGIIMAENKELEKKKTSDVREQEERHERYVRPRTSVREFENSVLISMDMPGVKKEDLEITFDRGELTVTGQRERWELENAEACFCERFDGSYRRMFALDDTLDASKIEANLDKGVLRLTIPKTEAVKPRQISIKTG
jgi:HSP20 family molecular chaperone IbpA